MNSVAESLVAVQIPIFRYRRPVLYAVALIDQAVFQEAQPHAALARAAWKSVSFWVIYEPSSEKCVPIAVITTRLGSVKSCIVIVKKVSEHILDSRSHYKKRGHLWPHSIELTDWRRRDKRHWRECPRDSDPRQFAWRGKPGRTWSWHRPYRRDRAGRRRSR